MRFWSFHRKERHSAFVWEPTTPQKPIAYLDGDGRRHRTDAPYLLPKDEKEIQRLDYQHFIFRQVLQGNTFAPVDANLREGDTVLDVGCGTGRWGYEMASTYPQAQVIGFDLEEVPHSVSTPLNYRFTRGNLLHGLPFAAQQFYYVHQRLLVAGIPLKQWPFVVEELRRVTHSGGWIELVEMGTIFHHAGPATLQFLAWWAAISQTRGIDASKVAGIGDLLRGLGCSEVRAKTERLPVGSWGGRVGKLLAQDILAGWPTMRPYAHSLLHVPYEQFDGMIHQLKHEWNTRHTIYEVYFACGRV